MILNFKVADAYFRLNFTNPEIDGRKLIPSCRPFYVKECDGPLMFDMTIGDEQCDEALEGEEIGVFDCGGQDHAVYRLADGGYKIIVHNSEKALASILRTNADFTDCRVRLYGNHWNQAFGLGNAMMMAFAFSGAYNDIILMHASVTMYEGKGYLFLGVSGTGKSTHSQQWLKYIPNTELLNDDNPAVRVVNGEPIVYGTPWSGKTPCYRNLSVPVGSFVRLKQHPENIIEEESPLKAFSAILSSSSSMIWDKRLYLRICDVVTAVVSKTKTYYLQCRADEEAARLSCKTIVR